MEAVLVQILEGALLAAGEPLSIQRMILLFEEDERPTKEDIRAAIKMVEERCEDRGYELVQVASGYRFQVRQDLAAWVGRLWQERPARYSRALMETLSLIAYRQPITRGEIEEIRGVAVSTNIVKTLLEREWVRVVGHRDVPGRPAMYATTRQFLDYFNLKSLDQLPPLAEIKELDNLSGELALELPEAAAEALGTDESVAEGVDAELESKDGDADAAEATTHEAERADNGEQDTPSP
ncbi:MAG: SMC-Scp complex subunit ScpB [Luminiphilus sp.]|nr:SMC-Scp complex subunit ScpB [Luminiphilus sp.]